MKSGWRKAEFLLPLLVMSTARGVAGWEQLPPLPAANGGFASGVLGKKVIVLGGTNWKDNTKQWLNVIWVFDPALGEWESHGNLPHPLAYAVTGEWQGALVIAGGTDGVRPRKEVWRLKSSLELSRLGELKEASALAVGGVFNGSLFVLGGCADPATLKDMRKGGERLNLTSGDTSALTLPGDEALVLGATVAVGRELFIFGGAAQNFAAQVVNLRAAWAYNAGKNGWRTLRPLPFAVRGASAVKLDQHRILIAGGFGGEPAEFTRAAYIYDTRRDTYAKALDLPVAALVGLVRAGDFVYCLGGEDRMKHRTAACFRVKVAGLLGVAKAKRSSASSSR